MSLCSYFSSEKMSDSRTKDSDLIYSVVDKVTSSDHLYEVPDNSTPNPAYGYTTLNKRERKKQQ